MSGMSGAMVCAPMLGPAVPVLHVGDSRAAEALYCQQLGFTRLFVYRQDESRADPCHMGAQRGHAVLHLSSFA